MSDPRETLLVRLESARAGESVTLPCPADLRFDSALPGGYRTLSCTVTIPAGTATPAVTETLATVRVLDRRTGATVWYGHLTDPGLLATSAEGQRYSLVAEGENLKGWREVYGLVDRAEESWQAVGEFGPGSVTFGGDLAPVGDLTVDVPADFGALTDFGDQLAVDFPADVGVPFGGVDLGNIDIGNLPGSLDLDNLGAFGGDLGTLGNIAVGGPTYPAVAAYPGYLGYLQDPSGGPGVMLPIPLGVGGLPSGFWTGWTTSGGVTEPSPGVGRLPSGSTAYWSTPIWTLAAGYGWDEVRTFRAAFRVQTHGTIRFWSLADPTFADSGHYMELDTATGALALHTMVAGTPVTYLSAEASASFPLTLGTSYTLYTEQSSTTTGGSFSSVQFSIYETALGLGAATSVYVDVDLDGWEDIGKYRAPPGLDWVAVAAHVAATAGAYGGNWMASTIPRYYGITIGGGGIVDISDRVGAVTFESASPDYRLP